MKPQRKPSSQPKHAVRRIAAAFPMPRVKPLAGPLQEYELIELENWLNVIANPETRNQPWWHYPRIHEDEAARRIRLLIEHARK